MLPLKDLLAGIEVTDLRGEAPAGCLSGVFDDSRQVRPGGLFIARRGARQDGRHFAQDAAARGAVVIVGDDVDPLPGVLTVCVRDARVAAALLAARFHRLEQACDEGFRLLGVTGTNGKSTTTHMTAAILRAAGWRCGTLGTLQYDLCARTLVAEMTTPGPIELAAYLRECVDAGGRAVVMEVSSHALHQRRTDGLRFAAAAFTNLTQDHLDYHGTLESYADAKAQLFQGLDPSATAVINHDDPAHARMLRDCRARRLSYSLNGPADLSAQVVRDTLRGTVFRANLCGATLVLENGLVGRHNVYNALAAAGLALALGIAPRHIEAGLSAVRNIPGRLQRVLCMPGVEVFVDYAHTDDALRNVLGFLRPLTRGNLAVVFGCGGDRDPRKRPLMARAVAHFADRIVVTSDNPRSEDPRRIIEDILQGFEQIERQRVEVEPDRRRAIRNALGAARQGDVVLIAGKGHENYQLVGPHRLHFDDVEVALQSGAELASASGAR
jgi:UDP-N-acetylmuramoyl-L-alanyl-D-glutamate--2,6-diaminopimelate ligase